MGNAFYRGTDACILVYDITDSNSFDQIDEWKRKFIQQSDIDKPNEYPFLLLGNKSDLNNNRVVLTDDAKEYATNNRMLFYETSAKTGNNIDQAIESIAMAATKQPTVPYCQEAVSVDEETMDNDGEIQPLSSYNGCLCELL